MDKKKLVLLTGALVVAVGTAMAARTMFAGASSPQAEAVAQAEQGPKVLVAKRALPAGTIITADAIGFQSWPQELLQDAYFLDGKADMSQLLGTVVRHPVTAGEPVTQGSLVKPGDRGFLAAALGAGMRAVTIPVSAQTGVGGFIFPGDRIDLMLTQEIAGTDGTQPLRTTETVLRNLRVLATDQSAESVTNEEGKTVVTEFRTVTLEVTPKMAEGIAVAQTIGELGMTLRSLADTPAELERAIASGEVELPANTTRAEEERLLRQVMASPQTGGASFVTGGDISRFQRSSMPSMRPADSGAQTTAVVVPPASGEARAASYVPRGPVVRVTRGQTSTTEAAGR